MRSIDMHKIQWNLYKQIPRKQSLQLTERTCAARRIADYARKLLASQTHRLRTRQAMGSIDRADTVELEIPVLATILRLQKNFHTAILTHRTLILVVDGSQIIAPHEKVYPQGSAVVRGGKSGQRLVRK